METKQQAGHYVKIAYDWIQPGPITDGKQKIDKYAIDTGFLKDWNLIKIEGEEPVKVVEADVDPKAKKAPPAKDTKAAGKGAPGQLEEITDNRPREISYSKDFGSEGQNLKFNDDMSHFFESFLMQIRISKTDRET